MNNTNTDLFSVQPFIDANGKLTYTPAADAFGEATVTMNVQDSGGTENNGVDTSANQTFALTINPVNDMPEFTKGSDQAVNEDSGAAAVNGWATGIFEGAANESSQTLTFDVTNDNNSFFSVQPSLNAQGNLTYQPADDAFGTANITVNLSDDGGTPNGGEDTSGDQTFSLTINPINDIPVFTKGGDQTVFEDAGSQNVNDWPSNISTGPANESGQSWDFEITNYNQDLFEAWGMPAIDGSGQLSFTPKEDANGSTDLTVSLIDDGTSVINGVLIVDPKTFSDTFTININPVNDVPLFTLGDDQSVNEDSGAVSVSGWATGIAAGPSDESGQVLTFDVTNDNNSLFSVQPTIDPDTGELSYTLADSTPGTAILSIFLQDNGGIANGGVNTSPIQAFTITVNNILNEDSQALALMNYYGVGGFAIPEKTSSVVIGNDLFESIDISPSGYIHGSGNGGPGEDGLEVSIVDNDNGDQGIMADDGFGLSFTKGDSGALVTTFRDHDGDSADDEGPNIEQGGTKGTSFYSRATGNSVTANTSFDDLLVSHEYRLDDLITDSHNVLVVDVTITNTGSETIRNLKYRKKADFDIDETDWTVNPEDEPIDRFIVPSIDPGDTLIESVSAPFFGTVGNDPLGIDITNSDPGPHTEDNAAVFQMDLGELEPDQSITFPVFFAADNPTIDELDPGNNRTASENLLQNIGRVGSTTYIEVSDPSNANATFALGSGNDSQLYVPIDAENEDISAFNIISDTLSTMIGLLAETTYSSHAKVIADSTDGLVNLTDIAIGSIDGSVFVTDSGSQRVLEVLPDGTVNTIADAADGINNPTGIANNDGFFLLVTDSGSKSILEMQLDGSFINTIADATDGINNPTGIAVNGGPYFISDSGSDSIIKYAEGISTIANENSTGGRLDEPQAIAFSQDGTMLYVVENGFDAILRIDQLTGETNRIATERSSDWDINEPVDITVGSDGFLYFVDAGNNSVFKVNPLTGETKFLASADTTGGLLSDPTGIAIDGDGEIYVSSATNGIVRLLKTTNDKTLHAQALKLRADIVAHDQEFSDPANAGIITALDGVIAKLQNNVDVGPLGDDGLSNNGVNHAELYIPATELFNDLETIRNNFIAQAGFPDSLASHTTVTHLLLDALKLADDSVSLHLDEIEANLSKAEAYLTTHSNDDGDAADGDLIELFSPILFDITILRDGDSTDEATDNDVRQGIESLLTNLVDHVSLGNNPFHSLQPFTNTDAVNMMFDNGVGGVFDPALALNSRPVIDNGTLSAGVNTDGSLIEEADFEFGTGLRMKGFTNMGELGGDVLTEDGYGVSYRTLDDQGLAAGDFVAKVGSGGGADSSTHGTTIYTKHNKRRMETFASQVGVDRNDPLQAGDLAVTHQFKLLPQADNAPEGDSRENVMSVEVTVTNTGDNTITDLLYRRLANIDSGSPVTNDDSFFTVHDDGISSDLNVTGAPNVDGTSADPDPPSLDPTTSVGNNFPSTYAGDLDALIQFDLTTLGPGESKTFEFFYAGDNSTDDLSNTIGETVTDARYVSSTSSTEFVYPAFALGTGTDIASFDRADVASREASYFNIFTDTMTLMIQNMAKAKYTALTVVDAVGTGGLIDDPSGIVIDGNGDLIVTDASSASVLKIEKDGAFPSGHQDTVSVITDDVNLLNNPGFESSLTDWTTDNAAIRTGSPSPHSGIKYLMGGANGTSSSYTFQTIDLLDEGFAIGELDSNVLTLNFGGWQSGWNTQTDRGKIEIVMRDTSLQALGSMDHDWFYSNHTWVLKEGSTDLLVGTRYIDYGFHAQRFQGSNNDAYLDDAFLDITSAEGLILAPQKIAVDIDGNFIIADNGSRNILKVNPTTGVTTVIADVAGSGGLIDSPSGIVVDIDPGSPNYGDLIVTDWGSDAVLRIKKDVSSPTGYEDSVSVVTDSSRSPGLFTNPVSVAIDSNGNIIVVDGSSAILRVDPITGKTAMVASEFITSQGEEIIHDPQGIAIDSNGLLIVSDSSSAVDDDGFSSMAGSILIIDPVSGDTKRIIALGNVVGSYIDDALVEHVKEGSILPTDIAFNDSDGSIFFVTENEVGNNSIVKLVETTSSESLLALAEKIRADMVAHNEIYSDSIIDDLAHQLFIDDLDGVIADIESNLNNPDNPGIWVSRQDIFDSLRTTRDLLAEHADMQEPVEHASIAHLLLDSKRLADDQVRLNLAAIDTEIGLAQASLQNHIVNSGNTTVHRYLLSQVNSIASNIDSLQTDIYDINMAALIQSGVEGAFIDVIDHMLFTDQERSHSHNELVHNPFEPHSPNGERNGDVMSSSEGLELMNYYGVGGFSIPENPNSVVIGNDFFTHIDIGPEGSIRGFADGKKGLAPSILNNGLNEEDRGILFDDGFGISFDKPGVNGALRATFGGGSDVYPDAVGTALNEGLIAEDIEVNGSKGKAFYSRSDGNSVTANTSFDDVQISHAYRLVESENSGANVLIAEITITNMGVRTISDLRYRRKTDFDIGGDKVNDYYGYSYFYSNESYFDQFDVPIPDPDDELVDDVESPYWDDVGLDPSYEGNDPIANNPGTDVGDNAAVIQMDLGTLGPGESITFPVIIAGDNPTVDEDNPANNRTASQNLADSIADVISTTYIEVSSTLLDESTGAYALGTGSLNLEAPTGVSPEGREHFQFITDTMSLMIGHLADTSYSSHAENLTVFAGSTGARGIAFDINGDLIVTDVQTDTIYRINPSDRSTSLITSGGLFDYPGSVAVDTNPASVDYGDLIVTDVFGQSLFRVDPSDGTTTQIWNDNMEVEGLTIMPTNVAIDGNGDLIVTDVMGS